MWLSDDLEQAASNHPTRYTKLILEAGQCLCSALHINGLGEQSPYGKGYINHPISRWAAESQQNWFQLLDYMSALHEHYYGWSYEEIRQLPNDTAWKLYNDENLFHKTCVSIGTSGGEKLVEIVFPDIGRTPRPKCVADWCKEESVTETYRKYFACCKQHYDWFEWSDGEPEWLDEYEQTYWSDYRKGQFQVYDEQD